VLEKRKIRKDNDRFMNIYEKVCAITHEASQVAKGMEVKLPNGSYKAVSEGDVLHAIKPLLEKYKVLILPIHRQILGNPYLTCKALDGKEKVMFYSRLKTEYKIVNVEDPNDFISTESYGDGVDTMDKSVGKAITYCDKYNILKLFMLITGEDADAEASQQITGEETDKEELKGFIPSEPFKEASEKQLKFIEALKLQKVYNEAIFRGQFGFWLSHVDSNEKARIVISFLQACPNKPKEEEPKADDNGVIADDDLPF
jgi:hypothetical protein